MGSVSLRPRLKRLRHAMVESKGRQRETGWSSLVWCHGNDRRAEKADVEKKQRAAMGDDTPAEVREELLKTTKR